MENPKGFAHVRVFRVRDRNGPRASIDERPQRRGQRRQRVLVLFVVVFIALDENFFFDFGVSRRLLRLVLVMHLDLVREDLLLLVRVVVLLAQFGHLDLIVGFFGFVSEETIFHKPDLFGPLRPRNPLEPRDRRIRRSHPIRLERFTGRRSRFRESRIKVFPKESPLKVLFLNSKNVKIVVTHAT